MPSLLTNDFAFSTLVEGVNAAPVSLGPVAASGLFDDRPGTSTDIAIELIDNNLTLVKSSLRGGPGDLHPATGRELVKLKAPHLRTSSTMLADAWQNRTGFNQGGAPANVLQERDRILREHRMRLEGTLDYYKARALAGEIRDADGSLMVDLLSEFGVSQLTVDCDLDVPATVVVNKIIAARRLAEAELGMAYAKSWVAFADAGYMDALRAHPSVAAAVEGWAAAAILLVDHRAGDLVIGGVRFVEVPNRAGRTYIDAGTAVLCPEGVPDLFVCQFAPADYVESVNEMALPFYAKAHELPFNRGLILESQTNPVPIVSRPRAVIKLTA